MYFFLFPPGEDAEQARVRVNGVREVGPCQRANIQPQDRLPGMEPFELVLYTLGVT